MIDTGQQRYTPSDRLYLWFLADPTQPLPAGELNLLRATQGVSVRYNDGWLGTGFPLSEDLPLIGEEFLPTEKGVAAGAVDDARPDRWGERVIRFIDRPPRLSLLEFLYFLGDDRFGALGVSTSPDEYLSRRLGPLPTLSDANQIHELVRKVQANETIVPTERRLISPGATLGGARPKALLDIAGEQWVIKFADGDPADTPLIEHAAMTLAGEAAIEVASTMPVRLTYGHALAIHRFDRCPQRRVHCLSAQVALRAAGDPFGYPELAQLLRRRGVAENGFYTLQMHELFRRMVFNILIDNTDDHEKNHTLLVTNAQRYVLSPAYDVLPSGQALGFQQMRIGQDEGDSTLANALSMSRMFALDRGQGDIFRFEACKVLQSNSNSDPAGPLGAVIPPRPAIHCKSSRSGTPTRWTFSESFQFCSGVSSTPGTKYWWEPGISINGPLNSLLSVSISDAETARIRGMPSSACQVSKSECHSKPSP